MKEGRGKNKKLMLLVLVVFFCVFIINAGVTKNAFGVRIPYNFTNDIGWLEGEGDFVNFDHFYAGERAKLRFWIKVKERYNQRFDREYVTDVDNAKVSVVEECYGEFGVIVGYFFKDVYDGKLLANQLINVEEEIEIPDLDAGTECSLRLTISPSDSGEDAFSWNSVDMNSRKTIFGSFKIAKKPNFQVWGNGIYLSDGVNVPMSKKVRVDGEDLNGGVNVFGSWAELSVVSNGQVVGLVSGAGVGYNISYSSQYVDYDYSKYDENFGGDKEVSYDFCRISTLTFANVGCRENNTGGNIQDNDNVLKSEVLKNKAALIGRFNDNNNDSYTLIDGGDEDIRVDNSSTKVGNTTDFPNNNEKSTKFIKTKGTIIIDKDITYNNRSMTNIDSIPKIIFYANNIKINCSVSRVDAILVADNNINTCVDENGNTPEDVNASIRSNQLVINGAIIANSLDLNRTYGAGMGRASIIPAEIINYDSSLYLWDERQEAEIKETKRLVETYSAEVAPRY